MNPKQPECPLCAKCSLCAQYYASDPQHAARGRAQHFSDHEHLTINVPRTTKMVEIRFLNNAGQSRPFAASQNDRATSSVPRTDGTEGQSSDQTRPKTEIPSSGSHAACDMCSECYDADTTGQYRCIVCPGQSKANI